MTILIIILSALILVVGLAIILKPAVVFGIFRKNSEKIELQILAVVIRLALGALLVYQADASKYPIVIEVIGWILIVAAVFLTVIGRQKFIQFITWTLKFVKPFGRIGGYFAVVLGIFLIHAFI